jgi:hypothetical protein
LYNLLPPNPPKKGAKKWQKLIEPPLGAGGKKNSRGLIHRSKILKYRILCQLVIIEINKI